MVILSNGNDHQLKNSSSFFFVVVLYTKYIIIKQYGEQTYFC